MTDDARNDTQPIIDAAIRAAQPNDLPGGAVNAIVVPKDGKLQVVDTDTDAYRSEPVRKTGTAKMQAADSLVAYITRHGGNATEVYADGVDHKIVAVINAGDIDAAGWGDHRAEFTIQHTEAWKAWTKNDDTWMSQLEFGQFLESHQTDLHEPPAVDMLKIAESIAGTSGGSFESTKRNSDGTVSIEYRENVDAKADKGRLEIPLEFTIAIRPFVGVAPYSVRALFRYRINGGNMAMAYKLIEPELVVDDAFEGVVNDVTEQIGDAYAVFLGVAPEKAPATPPRATIVG